jgi:hypothetical protein
MMFSPRTLISGALAGTMLVGLAAASAYVRWDGGGSAPEQDGWRRIAWPFPRDGWNEGQAWKGHGMELYARPKLGFCANCDTGVVEDAEVDRVSDIDLVDPMFTPGEGSRVQITDMVGRLRLYTLPTHKTAKLAAGFAVSHDCDLVVGLIVGDVGDPAKRQLARHFLESDTVQDWLLKRLGER